MNEELRKIIESFKDLNKDYIDKRYGFLYLYNTESISLEKLNSEIDIVLEDTIKKLENLSAKINKSLMFCRKQ